MDTPERSKNSQIATSIGKFEESPVFNFINSLSPIKPIKPIHITQTINPLSFASLPSVFSSPHLGSLRESGCFRRHQLSDPSKPEFSSDHEKFVDRNNLDVHVATKLDEHKENLDPRSSECENAARGPFIEDQRSVTINEANLEGFSNLDQYNWDSLIADASNLLAFESPNILSCKKSVDPATAFYRSIKNAIQNAQSLGAAVCEAENISSQPGEGNEMIENAAAHEHLPGIYRGMRRRCLVFEMAGAHRKQMEDGSDSDSPMLLKSDGDASSNQEMVPIKAGNDSSSLLPGIGLHLNSLAATSKDIKIVNHESSASGRLLIGPSSSASFLPPTSGQELLSNTLAMYSLERDIDTFESGGLPLEDPSQESGYIENEDVNASSPKKRRRRLDQGGDGESCKRCNCKKSKCLKLYCECFAAGVYCVEPCACIDCFNKPIHEDTVLATRKQIESRNPLAFAPKVIRGSDSLPEIGDDFTNTPASARHKRGCNCKKSGCLKKYCECYQGGVGCSINCRCEGCKNSFGRKDGSGTSTTEPEYEEDETDATETAAVDTSLYKTAIHDDLDQFMDSVPPATPLGATIRQPFESFSNKRPPRATFPSISSYSGLSASQAFGKSSLLPALPELRPCFETVSEDEMPDFLQGGKSPMSGIKSSSPNRKRVSPPQSTRKLILRSIPSFPSLAPNH